MSTKDMMLAGLFAAVLVVGSQLAIPLGPVPVTFQDVAVLLIGLLLGPRLGLVSVGLWILLGVFGLPVFAQGRAGAAVLIGPTGGFIAGFAVCVYLVGVLVQRRRLTFWYTWGVLMAGMLIVYVLGLCGFMASFTYVLHTPMTWNKGLALAVWPFLPMGIAKTGLTAYLGIKVRGALVSAGVLQPPSASQ